MFDKERLFRILYWLSCEEDVFMGAQDSYIICGSILDQLSTLGGVIDEYEEKIRSFHSEAEGKEEVSEMGMYRGAVEKLKEMQGEAEAWEPIISELQEEAEKFWIPASVDVEKCKPDQLSRSKAWRVHKSGDGNAVTDETKSLFESFQQHCLKVVSDKFPDYLEMLKQELDEAENVEKSVMKQDFRLSNSLPLSSYRDIYLSSNVYTLLFSFPVTHFNFPSKSLCYGLGYSFSRLLTVPFIQFIVNTAETNAVVESFVNKRAKNTDKTIIFYRCADIKMMCVHWEICEKHINGAFAAMGIDITSEMNAMRSNQGETMQKILRQWLHSIRNASFEQQALLIEEDVRNLQAKMGQTSNLYQSEIANILSGLKTLIYTSKASVGLIDQALQCKGIISSTCLTDFANAFLLFAPNFARSEQVSISTSACTLTLNQAPCSPEDLKHMYVGADLVTLQTMIDNIYSNAIRYTNPEKGVESTLQIVETDVLAQFVITITDYCDGGLPSDIVRYYQDNINHLKVIDKREIYGKQLARNRSSSCSASNDVEAVATSSKRHHEDPEPEHPRKRIKHASSSRSSLTGVPHIVELYHQLTGSGEYDVDMLITVTDSGTTFKIQFSLALLTPPITAGQPLQSSTETNLLQNYFAESDKKFLVVDDSAVIRRMLVRMFEKLEVPCHACVDGVQALEWFRDNHEVCCGLITDLEMPRMGGDSLIQESLKISPSLPCVVVSGNESVIDSLPLGALRALLKPITVNDLQKVLLDVLVLGN